MTMYSKIDDWSEFESHHVCIRKYLPSRPAIYFLCKSNGADGFEDNVIELLYIGQTKNLKSRISDHDYWLNDDSWIGNKFVGCHEFDCIFYKLLNNDANIRYNLEAEYIQEYFPKYNTKIPETYEVD